MTGVRLRPVAASDLDTFFEHQRDPVALRVGTLTSRDGSEFDTHWARILADPLGILRTVESEGAVVGYVGSFLEHAAGGRMVHGHPGKERPLVHLGEELS